MAYSRIRFEIQNSATMTLVQAQARKNLDSLNKEKTVRRFCIYLPQETAVVRHGKKSALCSLTQRRLSLPEQVRPLRIRFEVVP